MLISRNASGVAACAVMCLVAGVARADVVFGNLGPSGTNALSTTNTDITSTYRLAVPFTTGTLASTPLKLQSITLGLFYDNFATSSFTLSIYANNAGVPSNTVVATSGAQTVGVVNRYTFNFGNFDLAAGTTYWIRPETDLAWYTPLTSFTPVAYNSSGYSWPGTGLASSDSGATWNTDDLIVGGGRYAFSINAVPEPSTYVLAAAGLALAGLMRVRRRKAAV